MLTDTAELWPGRIAACFILQNSMPRDSVFWNGLRKQLQPVEAEAAFLALAPGGYLLAVDPYDSAKRIMVWFSDPSACADHYLYKRDHKRTGQGQKRRSDFLNDRAARINWIPQVLREPDRLKLQRSRLLPNGKTRPMSLPTFVYCCQTLKIGVEQEYFLIFVHRQTPTNYVFGTAMIATADYVAKCSRLCWTDIKKGPH